MYALVLGKLGDISHLAILLKSLQSEDASINDRATLALINLGTVGVAELIKLLNAKVSSRVRYDIAFILGKIRDKRAVKPLIETLAYEDAKTAERVVLSLSMIGDEQAIQPLIAVFENRPNDKELRETILEVLGDFDGKTSLLLKDFFFTLF